MAQELTHKPTLLEVIVEVLNHKVLQYPVIPLNQQGKSMIDEHDVWSIADAVVKSWENVKDLEVPIDDNLS